MFLIDDILLSPVYGVLWLGRKIHDAASAEQKSEADNITADLSQLYMRLETGQITEAEFDAQEKALLDRLDNIQEREAVSEDEAADQDDIEESGSQTQVTRQGATHA